MIVKYDVVRLLTQLPRVPSGSIGTVLDIADTAADYLVEFVNLETGESLDVVMVHQKDIEKVDRKELGSTHL